MTDENARNFQPPTSSYLCEIACDVSAGSHVLGNGKCIEQVIEFRIYDSYFQPSNCTQKFISGSGISSHTLPSCLVEDILLLEQPTFLRFENLNDALL